MDIETGKLMEAMKWFTSERLKKLQRKLTTASNTIKNEALSSIVYYLY